MEVALRSFLPQYGLSLQVLDVDRKPERAYYDESVPVLLLDGEEICRYFLDEAKLKAALGPVRISLSTKK
jgi:hypothetical protein